MHLKKITLLNFKNLRECDLELSEAVNCFLGDNGEGKTNLLDAVYYLSFTKSFYNAQDQHNVTFDEQMMMLQGSYEIDAQEELIHCGVKLGAKKTFSRNKKKYDKLAEHVGLIPVVIITPNDSDLITEGSVVRRKFLDSFISQFDKMYLRNLIAYNRIIIQKNAFLKQLQEGSMQDQSLLDVLNMQLEPLLSQIHQSRAKFLKEFENEFQEVYNNLSQGKEQVTLFYDTKLNEIDVAEGLEKSKFADKKAGHATFGIHKDDLQFQIKDRPLKKFGSQGQQKTYLIALKLATIKYIKEQRGCLPIVLLDDIFDKLDEKRISYLLSQIKSGKLGQTFISDTSMEKVPSILNELGVDHKVFHVKDGVISAQ